MVLNCSAAACYKTLLNPNITIYIQMEINEPDIKNKQPSVSEEYFDSEESFKNEGKQSGVKNLFSKYF